MGSVIFISGVHGVGKTTMCSLASAELGILHKSASQLIKEAKENKTTDRLKLVDDVDGNQILLVNSLSAIRNSQQQLLLDGHFVLFDSSKRTIEIETKVFSQLGIDSIVLIVDQARSIADRLGRRDMNGIFSLEEIEDFQRLEARRAEEVASDLNLTLKKINSFDQLSFNQAISDLLAA
jgi:adenylate kinase